MNSKKAQNEIVGFVLIVVLVVVIGVIFLGISLRKAHPVSVKDAELSSFLESGMRYTSECAVSYEPDYDNMQDLIKSCYNNRNCRNNLSACDVLNLTYTEMLKASFPVGEDRPVKAHILNISFKSMGNNTPPEEILLIKSGEYGNCSIERGAESVQAGFNGNIYTRMSLCYT